MNALRSELRRLEYTNYTNCKIQSIELDLINQLDVVSVSCI